MELINPIAGSLLQSTQMQRMQAAEKSRQARRAKLTQKVVTADGEELEHQVESSEEILPVHDEQNPHDLGDKKKKGAPGQEAEPHLDLTA